MKALTRSHVISALRRYLVLRSDDDHSACEVAR
jgi:hypothetical protein